jgi:hypothetical protein
MEHSLHLAAKHFFQAMVPHHDHSTSASDSGIDTTSYGGEDNDTNDKVVHSGDLLGKAIALVKQVSNSTTLLSICTNSCCRFINHHKQGPSSVHHALKLGLCHLSSCFAFALTGDHSSAFSSISSNLEPYISFFLYLSSCYLTL